MASTHGNGNGNGHIRLAAGHITEDPRLDRVPQFDERSRQYPIRTLPGEGLPLRSFGWRCPTWLDQGQEGACVGFSWSHELAAFPVAVDNVDDGFAHGVYKEAQTLDEWPGEDYEGTSVLGGAKAVSGRGYMDEYRWAFGVEDALRAIGYHGLVVIGIPWYESMFRPRPSGLVEVEPGGGGGHAILVRGVSLKARLKGEQGSMPVVRLRNSWGRSWGVDGDCYVRVEDFERLLNDHGECCVPVKRSPGPAPHPDEAFLAESGEAV